MEIVIERALEAFDNIDHRLEAGIFQRLASKNGTAAAATDEHHRPRQVALDQTLHIDGEMRIDLPVRRLLPGDMLGADRMTDIHVLDLRAAIDQDGCWRLLQEGMGGKGIEMLHRCMGKFEWTDIMKASRRKA